MLTPPTAIRQSNAANLGGAESDYLDLGQDWKKLPAAGRASAICRCESAAFLERRFGTGSGCRWACLVWRTPKAGSKPALQTWMHAPAASQALPCAAKGRRRLWWGGAGRELPGPVEQSVADQPCRFLLSKAVRVDHQIVKQWIVNALAKVFLEYRFRPCSSFLINCKAAFSPM